jgi:hypothetical protein
LDIYGKQWGDQGALDYFKDAYETAVTVFAGGFLTIDQKLRDLPPKKPEKKEINKTRSVHNFVASGPPPPKRK